MRELVASTGMFTSAEADVAVELVDERLAKGPSSGYDFLFLESDGQVCGYVCYGHIAVTQSSYDLYWIVVGRAFQRRGYGQALLAEAEKRIERAGGTRVYIETSDREEYHPTRAFYHRGGYVREACLKDFYAPGDDRVVYVKVVG